jgi:sugar lactone lactonase YvrE/enterochelin esterase-like enzyme
VIHQASWHNVKIFCVTQAASPSQLRKLEELLSVERPEVIDEIADDLSTSSGITETLEWLNPSPDDQYKFGPDSLPQAGVPKGKIFEFTLDRSMIFPGTSRKITVYVPSEYSTAQPACVYVALDDLNFAVPNVFDNLIFKHELPITIAIGIAPGKVASSDASQNPRFNRSFEFDGLNDNLARFLIDEVFPEVEKHKTPDGLPIILSTNPNDRAAGGLSTAGIAAFTLAWENPEAFRRVYTAVGTFVGMRGGDRYPVLVRKTEPKPIRLFMVDGSNDEWMGGPELGDRWMSNQTLERALEFAGYQVNHAWGEETHDGRHATAIFPDAMRWLWKDWPQPVSAGQSQNLFLQAILETGRDWQVVTGEYESDDNVASDPSGAIFFRDLASGRTRKLLENGKLSENATITCGYSTLAFDSDGRFYLSGAGKIVVSNDDGKLFDIAADIDAQQLVVSHDRRIYATESGSEEASGKVWMIQPDGHKTLIDSGLNHPSGIALSPDGLWLAVAENKTHWGYSYRVESDGTVQDKQRFYWLHAPDTAADSGVTTWAMDREGRLYAATPMGVQVLDRNGRVRAILPLPAGQVIGLAFGEANFDTLYVSCADHKLYYRKLKVSGAPSWIRPVTLPTWSQW